MSANRTAMAPTGLLSPENVMCVLLPGACIGAAARREAEAASNRAAQAGAELRAEAGGAVRNGLDGLAGVVREAGDPIGDLSEAAETVSIAIVVGVLAIVALVIYLSLRYG